MKVCLNLIKESWMHSSKLGYDVYFALHGYIKFTPSFLGKIYFSGPIRANLWNLIHVYIQELEATLTIGHDHKIYCLSDFAKLCQVFWSKSNSQKPGGLDHDTWFMFTHRRGQLNALITLGHDLYFMFHLLSKFVLSFLITCKLRFSGPI